jgi:hypothetical protein
MKFYIFRFVVKIRDLRGVGGSAVESGRKLSNIAQEVTLHVSKNTEAISLTRNLFRVSICIRTAPGIQNLKKGFCERS